MCTVANQLTEPAEAVSEIARSLGHEVVVLELNVERIAELTRKEHPDVALVGLGESSQHALELIEQIDIVLRRFAEYHNLEGAFGRRATIERAKGTHAQAYDRGRAGHLTAACSNGVPSSNLSLT